MPTAKIGDITMYYEVHGEGAPLLLIYGLGGDLTGWGMQIPEFSKTYQVIVFDNRGVGRTDAPDIPYSMKLMAEDTVGLLDHLHIDQIQLLGFSMGSCIDQELTIHYPHRVKSLLLTGGGAYYLDRVKYIVTTWVKLCQARLNRELFIRNLLPWNFSDKYFENPDQVQIGIKVSLEKPEQPAYALARQAAANLNHDTRNRLDQITAPTRVLAAKDDLLCSVKLQEELAAGIPNAELVILEGGAHGCHLEIPGKFNQAVLEFLAKVEN